MLDTIVGREKFTTEVVWRTGDKIRPIFKQNLLGRVAERVTGLGIRAWPFGGHVQALRVHNLITNVGHAAANGKMSNQGGYLTFTTLAVGTGTLTASVNDTALGNSYRLSQT